MTSYQIMDEWARSLVADAGLDALCKQLCGKGLKVFVGLDVSREPGSKDAPYVCLQPAGDVRGPEVDEHRWSIVVYLGLTVAARVDKGAAIVAEPALVAMDRDFAPAVMRVLAATTAPPVEGEGITHPVKGDYAERDVVVTVREPNVIGIGADGWQ